MSLIVRGGRPEDWPAMQTVFTAAARAAWMHMFTADFFARLVAPARWRPVVDEAVLVAEWNAVVVGFSCLQHAHDAEVGEDSGEVDAFYTHPGIWGRGVGRGLMSAVEARLRRRGCESAILWTDERNHRPLRFYHAAGWTADGTMRRRAFLGAELIELRLGKMLADSTREPAPISR